MNLSESYIKKIQELSGIPTKKFYNSHGITMPFEEFKEIEVEERENYTEEEVDAWVEKYGIDDNDSVIWVTPNKRAAQTYDLNAEDFEKVLTMADSDFYEFVKDKYDLDYEDIQPHGFDESEGIIVPESDDGENGFLMLLGKRSITENRMVELAGLIKEDETISPKQRKTASDIGWKGSESRTMGYDEQAVIDAINTGRVIGVSYQSADMPVTKFRFVMPVFLGTYKNGTKKLRAYHVAGQSEKAAQASRNRKGSAEAYGEWRLFNVEPGADGVKRFKSMWFTDKYFFDNPPKYNANDKGFSGRIASYNAAQARATYYAKKPEGEPELATLQPTPEKPTVTPTTTPVAQPTVPSPDVTMPGTGYDDELDETIKNPKIARNKLIRPLFKKKKK